MTLTTRLAPIALGLLMACGTTGPRHSPLPSSDDTVLLSVPAASQDEPNECGLATLSTLCSYHGLQLSAHEVRRLTAIAEREEGLSGGELRGALHGLGMAAFLFHGTLDHAETGLYRHVDRGRPPLVMISRDGERAHYCLFTGYDPALGTVYVYDPRRGHLCLPVGEFEPLWERARRFTLLAFPPQDPISNPSS